MRRALPGLALAVLLFACAGTALAAAPTDPSAGGQQPLSILRVGDALDHIGPALGDVPVLVADTGLMLQSPDLAPRLFSMPAATPAPDPDNTGNAGTVAAGAAGWDLIGTDAPGPLQPDADPSDSAPDGGHGTAVAGVLGAAWNNGAGGAGVAPNARFLALRTCWGGDQCYEYVQASAFNWAADRGVRVVSMSWLSGTPIEPGLAAAISSHPNVLFVAIPSGNGGACNADAQPGDADACGDVNAQTPPMPCGLNVANVLCVTTSSPTDGLDCGAYGVHTVDVAVPTQNSVTTNRDGGFSPTACATSYAAPTAAGLATILFGIDPTATASDVRAAIVDSARKVPAFDGKSVSGGIADAVAAVDLFQSRRGIAGRTPPTPDPGPTGPVPGPSPGPVADTTAPGLTMRIAPARFRAGRRAATLRIGLTEPAKVTVTWSKIRAKRSAGSLSRSLRAGTTKLAFAAKDRRGRKLGAGRYRLVARAVDAAGNASKLVTAVFTIKRG
jgi:opacity protein-like surface antigen